MMLLSMTVTVKRCVSRQGACLRRCCSASSRATTRYPRGVAISQNCRDLLARILVTDPSRRICIKEIQQHPWCAGLLFALPSWASIALP